MNYSLYNNPFYPLYMPYNLYERGYSNSYFSNLFVENKTDLNNGQKEANLFNGTKNDDHRSIDEIVVTQQNDEKDFFSITEDRLQVFGISINIDDLIILVMLFFMFKETSIDYILVIVLALILFDQD